MYRYYLKPKKKQESWDESRGNRGQDATPRLPALLLSVVPSRRSLLPITVQPLFSTIHCKCLYSIANNVVHSFMLSSRNARASYLKDQSSPAYLCLPTRTYTSSASLSRGSVATRPATRKKGLREVQSPGATRLKSSRLTPHYVNH